MPSKTYTLSLDNNLQKIIVEYFKLRDKLVKSRDQQNSRQFKVKICSTFTYRSHVITFPNSNH
jgi:hypothetical protein